MNKRIYLAAALVAAMTAFTGCTSEEELAQVTPEQPTTTGVPFTINATVEEASGTRATDVTSSTGSNPLLNFQLYATDGTNTWIDGATFTRASKSDAWGTTDSYNWAEGTSTFYGISNNSATAPTFTGTITNGSFTYAVPTDVDNGQEDLLVGKTTGDATSGASITFTHALGAVTALNVKLNCLLTGTQDAEGTYLFKATEIAFCNLITTGTYAYEDNVWSTQSLASTDAWEAVTTGKETITGTLPGTVNTYLVPSDTPETVTINNSSFPEANYTASWAINLANNIYLLPQSYISPWDPGTKSGNYYPNNPTDESEVGAYVRIKCVFAWADEDFANDGDDAWVQPYVSEDAPDTFGAFKTDAGAYIYVPFSAVSIDVNKGYTLNINLIKAYTIDGNNNVIPIIATASMDA